MSSQMQIEQESITVRCAQPACQPYLHWWSPLGVTTGGGGVDNW